MARSMLASVHVGMAAAFHSPLTTGTRGPGRHAFAVPLADRAVEPEPLAVGRVTNGKARDPCPQRALLGVGVAVDDSGCHRETHVGSAEYQRGRCSGSRLDGRHHRRGEACRAMHHDLVMLEED